MITIKTLTNQVELLNEHYGLNYELTAWSPGDGWNRYQLVTVETGTGAQYTESPCYNASEMSAYLRGFRDALMLKDKEIEKLNASLYRAHIELSEIHDPANYDTIDLDGRD